jgi:hypothetical protein
MLLPLCVIGSAEVFSLSADIFFLPAITRVVPIRALQRTFKFTSDRKAVKPFGERSSTMYITKTFTVLCLFAVGASAANVVLHAVHNTQQFYTLRGDAICPILTRAGADLTDFSLPMATPRMTAVCLPAYCSSLDARGQVMNLQSGPSTSSTGSGGSAAVKQRKKV